MYSTSSNYSTTDGSSFTTIRSAIYSKLQIFTGLLEVCTIVFLEAPRLKTTLKLLKLWRPCQQQPLLYMNCWVKHISKIKENFPADNIFKKYYLLKKDWLLFYRNFASFA